MLSCISCAVPPLSLSLSPHHSSASCTHSRHAEAAGIVRSICLAVGHLHYMNIAHRDLKVSDDLWVRVGKKVNVFVYVSPLKRQYLGCYS